jgi:hypothetical protein
MEDCDGIAHIIHCETMVFEQQYLLAATHCGLAELASSSSFNKRHNMQDIYIYIYNFPCRLMAAAD